MRSKRHLGCFAARTALTTGVGGTVKFLVTVMGGRWNRPVGHAAAACGRCEVGFACVDAVAAAETPTADAATATVPAMTAALASGTYQARPPYLRCCMDTFLKVRGGQMWAWRRQPREPAYSGLPHADGLQYTSQLRTCSEIAERWLLDHEKPDFLHACEMAWAAMARARLKAMPASFSADRAQIARRSARSAATSRRGRPATSAGIASGPRRTA